MMKKHLALALALLIPSTSVFAAKTRAELKAEYADTKKAVADEKKLQADADKKVTDAEAALKAAADADKAAKQTELDNAKDAASKVKDAVIKAQTSQTDAWEALGKTGKAQDIFFGTKTRTGLTVGAAVLAISALLYNQKDKIVSYCSCGSSTDASTN